ncbi:MAG: DEAD/DEAH box helicase [Candidatus Woesearchaeota archaeon]|jgi:helicase|nr:DEAD/DEAH box helicase [Candidatus Woesearchaeota archaeon]
MELRLIKHKIPKELYTILEKEVKELRPAQEKAIKKGLLERKNLLVCTPTASGKTLIAELAALKSIIGGNGKAIYIVPLKALASEKYKDFKKRYDGIAKVALSIGDIDSTDSYLVDYDLIITTSEKLDSLIRHHAPWLSLISTIIIDEIHLLNDPGRGPTLEILITILRQLLNKAQIIALSATIGNPEELSEWLKAELVIDDWRPVKLHKGVYLDGDIEFE